MKKNFFVLAVLCILIGSVQAAVTLRITANREVPNYQCNEPILIRAEVLEDGKPISGRRVSYTLLGDGGLVRRGEFVSEANRPFELKTALAFPGAVRSEFFLLSADGKIIPAPTKYNPQAKISGCVGAAVEPEKLTPSFHRPDDFDAYWDALRKQLLDTPMQVKKVRIAERDGIVFYDLSVSCPGGKPVTGYLAMPSDSGSKSRPAIACYPGAGVVSANLKMAEKYAKLGYIALSMNALGILNAQPPQYYHDLAKGEYKDYFFRVYETKESNFYTGLCLRVMRSLQYLTSLPQWNGRDLVVCGSSQGGYMALAAAALEPKVTLCWAGVPGLADMKGDFFGEVIRMPRRIISDKLHDAYRKRGDEYMQKVLAEYAYGDLVSFAPRIRNAKCYITFGYCDTLCPTTSVYNAFNAIPATTEKHLLGYPNGKHPTSTFFPEAAQLIREIGKRNR